VHTKDFDIKRLKYLNFHWFWGLWYSTKQQPGNIGSEVEALIRDENKLNQIITNQLIINQQNVVLRFFYRLFNINNYAFHTYLLEAYNGYKQRQESRQENILAMNREDNERSSTAEMSAKMPSPLFDITTPWSFSGIYNYFTSPSKNSSEPNAENTAVINEELPSKEEQAKDEFFLITFAMQPHLKVLGIHSNIGDKVTLSHYKSTCRAQWLKSHPDKPTGSNDLFCRVNNAIESIKNLLNPETSVTFQSYFDDLRRRVDERNAAIDKLAQDMAQDRAEQEQYRAEQKQYRAKQSQDFDELQKQIDQLKADYLAKQKAQAEQKNHNSAAQQTEPQTKNAPIVEQQASTKLFELIPQGAVVIIPSWLNIKAATWFEMRLHQRLLKAFITNITTPSNQALDISSSALVVWIGNGTAHQKSMTPQAKLLNNGFFTETEGQESEGNSPFYAAIGK
jgi:hypothetical protein